MPHPAAFHQQHGRKHALGVRFEDARQGIERVREWGLFCHHREHARFARADGLGPPHVGEIGECSHEQRRRAVARAKEHAGTLHQAFPSVRALERCALESDAGPFEDACRKQVFDRIGRSVVRATQARLRDQGSAGSPLWKRSARKFDRTGVGVAKRAVTFPDEHAYADRVDQVGRKFAEPFASIKRRQNRPRRLTGISNLERIGNWTPGNRVEHATHTAIHAGGVCLFPPRIMGDASAHDWQHQLDVHL